MNMPRTRAKLNGHGLTPEQVDEACRVRPFVVEAIDNGSTDTVDIRITGTLAGGQGRDADNVKSNASAIVAMLALAGAAGLMLAAIKLAVWIGGKL